MKTYLQTSTNDPPLQGKGLEPSIPWFVITKVCLVAEKMKEKEQKRREK